MFNVSSDVRLHSFSVVFLKSKPYFLSSGMGFPVQFIKPLLANAVTGTLLGSSSLV